MTGEEKQQPERMVVTVPESIDVQLTAQVRRPAGAPDGVVVVWPAMGVPASYYAPFCQELADRGLAVVAADLRGQGESRPLAGRMTTHGYHELACRDWPAMLRAVRTMFGDAVPVYLLGHSIGGQISALYLAQDASQVDGLLLVASGSVDFRGFPGPARWWVLLATQLMAAVSTVYGYWPGDRLGFGGRQPARLIRDWARICRTGGFAPAGGAAAYEDLLRDVQLPVLAISVAGDTLAPSTAVDRLCATLPSATVERWHYKPDDGRRVDHTKWARSGAPIAERIRQWVEERRRAAHRDAQAP